MPQLSLYFDRVLYKEVASIAKERGQSLSGVVSDMVRDNIRNSWPEHFFEEVVGALKDRIFEIPEDVPWSPGEGETF
jgi:hypothetical protein